MRIAAGALRATRMVVMVFRFVCRFTRIALCGPPTQKPTRFGGRQERPVDLAFNLEPQRLAAPLHEPNKSGPVASRRLK